MNNNKNIIVSIVEDDKIIANALKSYLNTLPQIVCDIAYPTAEDALEGIPSCKPNIVIMDIGLPGLNGVDCLSQLLKQLPDLKVIMFTVFDADELLFNALKAGASGYLLKDAEYDIINTALKDVLAGGAPMSPAIAKKVIKSFRNSESVNKLEKLTEHQKTILGFIAEGYLNKEIAEKLSVKEGTIKEQIRRIYKKLQVNNRVEASNVFRKSQ